MTIYSWFTHSEWCISIVFCKRLPEGTSYCLSSFHVIQQWPQLGMVYNNYRQSNAAGKIPIYGWFSQRKNPPFLGRMFQTAVFDDARGYPTHNIWFQHLAAGQWDIEILYIFITHTHIYYNIYIYNIGRIYIYIYIYINIYEIVHSI